MCQNACRQGHEFLLPVDADEVNDAEDEQLLITGAVHVLVEEEAVIALSLDAGVDLDRVAEDRALFEGHLRLIDHEAYPLVVVEVHELIDAEDMLTGALEVLEVVRMVDHARVVGILVINLNRMHVMRRHGGTLALIFLVGCSSPESSPVAPERLSEGPDDSVCRLSAAYELGSMRRRPRRLALSVSPEGGWVFLELAEGKLAALRLDRTEGAPRASRSLLDAPAASLRFALPLGAGHLAITEGACVIENESRRCLHAIALPARHGGRSLVQTVPLPGSVHTLRRRRGERSLFIARSHTQGPPVVDVFSIEAGRLLHRSFPLAGEARVGERASEILGLAVEGERWAALFRHGGIEDPEGELLLATEDGALPFEPLHHALLIDSFGFTSEGLAAIATFEFARAHLYRFDLEGRMLAEPALVPPGGPIPRPFAERVRVSLADDGERLWLSRTDGAGDSLGERVEIERRPRTARLPADVARVGGDYAVVFMRSSEEGWKLMRRDLSCASMRPPE